MICLTLGALLLAPPVDLKGTLAARYRQYNEAVKRNDGKAMVGWYRKNSVPTFRYTSKEHKTFDRAAFFADLEQQVAMVSKPLKSEIKVSQVEVRGKTAVATVSTDFEGEVNFDTKTLRLADKSTFRDTWTQGKSGWLLTQSVQTKSDTQMFGK